MENDGNELNCMCNISILNHDVFRHFKKQSCLLVTVDLKKKKVQSNTSVMAVHMLYLSFQKSGPQGLTLCIL